jgi:hypothetical protein
LPAGSSLALSLVPRPSPARPSTLPPPPPPPPPQLICLVRLLLLVRCLFGRGRRVADGGGAVVVLQPLRERVLPAAEQSRAGLGKAQEDDGDGDGDGDGHSHGCFIFLSLARSLARSLGLAGPLLLLALLSTLSHKR